ncbi:MAG: VWA domain-containing protein, partial [Deltaproteobacteria bacterium]
VTVPRPGETRRFEFGDPLDLDVVRTLLSAVQRRARTAPDGTGGVPVALELDDFEIHECDFTAQTTTVLLLDMSWSMSWAGRFPAAKRVALALDHLIRTRFPRDHFFIAGFYTRARELRLCDLPEATWNMGDPFTNLQEGLMVAERLIAKHPSPAPQVIVITDGQPTAYFAGKELRVEWPTGFGGVSPRAVGETLKQVRRLTRRGVTINTFMLDHSPELVSFVEEMTRVNRGRAFYTRPGQLGTYVMVDYLSKKRKLHR